jgi:hypothetical protein
VRGWGQSSQQKKENGWTFMGDSSKYEEISDNAQMRHSSSTKKTINPNRGIEMETKILSKKLKVCLS